MALTCDPMTGGDIEAMAGTITAADAAELAAAGISVADALAGVSGQALRADGRLCALFGAEPHPADGSGIPWLLATDALQALPRSRVARLCRINVQAMRERFPVLRNLVHRHNPQALALIRWLGFTIDQDPTGPGGQFLLFHWGRGNV